MQAARPTVLLIAPEYPPAYPVGYARTAAFEKYLPQFGFRTAVLTMRSYGALATDRERRVYRALDAGALYLPFTRRFLPSPRPRVPGMPPPGAATSPLQNALRIMLGAARELAMNTLVPDFQITWLPAALWVGLRAVRVEQPGMIYSSSPPETAHLVAGLLSRLTRLPWVADFRDGWTFESLKPPLRREGWRSRLERRLERWAVSRASAVVAVTQPITDYFRQAYPDLASKCYTVPNGYDPDDWQAVQLQARETSRLRLVHTGAFSYSATSRDPRPFFEALAMLPRDVRAQIEMLLVGTLAEIESRLIAELGLGNVVHTSGQKSKAESLGYQLSADVLVLLAGQDKSVATSKLYEYLYAGRPILALAVPDGAAAQIVTQTASGVVVDPTDSAAIAAALTRLYEQWRAGTLAVQPAGVEAYHRHNLTRQLADVFNAVLAGQSRR